MASIFARLNRISQDLKDTVHGFIRMDLKSHMLIGIWRVQKNVTPPLITYFTYGTNKGYAYSISAGKRTTVSGGHSDTEYGVKCCHGDIVEMILDFDELSLSFKVNGKDYGKSHGVTQDKYRAAIFMMGANDQVHFLG